MSVENMTTEEILRESALMDLEMKKISLELNQEALADLKGKKEARLIKMRKQQEDIAKNAQLKEQREKACNHRKGGRNKAGLVKGNAPNYSIIVNTYPAGNKDILCQRCGKEWKEPLLDLRATDPDLYKRLMREYERVLEWPTDNEPSGTQLFLITKHKVRSRRVDDDDEEETTPRIRAPRSGKGKGKTKAA
jgi:hypothetical protein